MLRTLEEIDDCAIGAVDGVIGQVKDLYVDDEAWVVRYLVVETGNWLSSRKVLISPIAIGAVDWSQRLLPVSVTMEQVRNSPDFDSEKPVTRQHEQMYSGYYGYPYYWDGMGGGPAGGLGYWGGGMYPNLLMPGYGGLGTSQRRDQETRSAEASRDQREDPHLRSCAAVTGYHLRASDGEIGHVCGMLIDPETWAVRYLIVDTSNWWMGHRMLVAPKWVEAVNWADRVVSVNLTRQAVKEAPAYDPDERLTRDDEARLHEHYGRPGYWTDSERRETEISRI